MKTQNTYYILCFTVREWGVFFFYTDWHKVVGSCNMFHKRNPLLFASFLAHTTQFLVILFSLSLIDSLSVCVLKWRPCDLSFPRYTCDCHVVGWKQHSVKAVILSSVAMNWSGVHIIEFCRNSPPGLCFSFTCTTSFLTFEVAAALMMDYYYYYHHHFITFMWDIYSFIPETTHVFRALVLQLFPIYNMCYM